MDERITTYKRSSFLVSSLLKWILVGSILIHFGCTKESNGFVIKGELDGFPEHSKIILSDAITGKILDSTLVKSNHFKIAGYMEEEPSLLSFTLVKDDGQFFNSFLFVGNESIKLQGKPEDFPDNLKVSGSKYHQYKSRLDTKVASLNKERDKKLAMMFSLRQEGEWNDSLQKQYWSKEGIITKIDRRINALTKEFIEQNINSDYALLQLVTYKTEFSKAFIEAQLNELEANFRNSKYALVLQTFLKNPSLDNGDRYYDFTGENTNGHITNFSDSFNGKYVLLEFYSPYCSWCVRALPEVKTLYESEKNNLEIVMLNVDKNKDDWLQKYEENGISWTSLYDENARYSEAFTKYEVNTTPSYFLFDPSGKLLHRWEGYRENLREQIQVLLK